MIEQIVQIDGFIALYIFMLAAFVGYEIIGKVPAILHTPLMSGSNFIHGIVLVGAMIALGQADTQLEKIIGFSPPKLSSVVESISVASLHSSAPSFVS